MWLIDYLWVKLAFLVIAFLVVFGLLRLAGMNSSSDWRWYKTFAVVLGGVSFLSVAFDSGIQNAQAEARQLLERAVSRVSELRAAGLVLEVGCTPTVQTENSPPNYRVISDERRAVCNWGRQFGASIDQAYELNPVPVSSHWLQEFPSVSEPPLVMDQKLAASWIADWNAFAEQFQNVQRRATTSPWRVVLLTFAPYLLAIAFALTLGAVWFEKLPPSTAEN